jgi:hypothetical protein
MDIMKEKQKAMNISNEGELLAHRKFATAGFHDESGEPGRGPRSQRPEQGNARLGCNEEESNECRQDAAAEEQSGQAETLSVGHALDAGELGGALVQSRCQF